MGMTIQRRKAVIQCCWWSLQWKLSLQKGRMKPDRRGGSYSHHVGGAWKVLTEPGRKGSRSLAPSLFPQNLTPWHFQRGTEAPNLPARIARFPAQRRLHTGSLNCQITDLLFAFGVWVCLTLSLSLKRNIFIFRVDTRIFDSWMGVLGGSHDRGANGTGRARAEGALGSPPSSPWLMPSWLQETPAPLIASKVFFPQSASPCLSRFCPSWLQLL